MTDIVTPILQWLNSNPELAGFATFLISAAESVAIIGTIVPGSVMMTAIGALVGAGIIPFWPTLIWAILGAIVGDGISYWLGHYFKGRLHGIWPFRSHPNLLESGERFFDKYGGMSVFIGRFVGPVRALVPMIAGSLGVKPIRFTVANIASAIIWAPAYMLPGFILGAASTELPSELAGRIILMLLLTLLSVILFIWLIIQLLRLIHMEIEQILNWIWNTLKISRYFYLITSTLRHYDSKKTHGQLILAFYFIATSCIFLFLASYILYHGPYDLFINNLIFHLFRSLRTPTMDHVMFYITLMGDKYVVLPFVFTGFCWFLWKKRWYTALHVLALGILAVGSVEFFKHFVHSPRPWGVVNNEPLDYSFPSGHTTLAFTFYFAICFLLIRIFDIKKRWPLNLLVGIVATMVAISRLYFGVHWFTDILGGILLSAAMIMLITISYNRIKEKEIQPKGFILTIVLTFLISYSATALYSYGKLRTSYTLVPWPTHQTTLNNWWQQRGEDFPIVRVNRFGLSVNGFNVQWLDDLDHIKNILLNNGWQLPPPRDWLTILYRISSVQSSEHLPLASPLYLDEQPKLVLIKYMDGSDKLIIIRFWPSPFIFKNIPYPLWLGSVDFAPSTYSWLFKKKSSKALNASLSLLFTKPLKNYDIKTLTATTKNDHHSTEQSIILIKPKNLSNTSTSTNH